MISSFKNVYENLKKVKKIEEKLKGYTYESYLSRFLWPYRDVNDIIRLHVNCIIKLPRHRSVSPVSDICYI